MILSLNKDSYKPLMTQNHRHAGKQKPIFPPRAFPIRCPPFLPPPAYSLTHEKATSSPPAFLPETKGYYWQKKSRLLTYPNRS